MRIPEFTGEFVMVSFLIQDWHLLSKRLHSSFDLSTACSFPLSSFGKGQNMRYRQLYDYRDLVALNKLFAFLMLFAPEGHSL